jgi:hypothetical protein
VIRCSGGKLRLQRHFVSGQCVACRLKRRHQHGLGVLCTPLLVRIHRHSNGKMNDARRFRGSPLVRARAAIPESLAALATRRRRLRAWPWRPPCNHPHEGVNV